MEFAFVIVENPPLLLPPLMGEGAMGVDEALSFIPLSDACPSARGGAKAI